MWRTWADAIVAALYEDDATGQTYELGGPEVATYAELMDILLHEVRRKRFLVPVPFFIGDIQATFAGLLPNPPVTRDSMKSLREDNVVSDDANTLADLGVQATAMQTILPTYLHRYRKGGRIGRASMS